MWTGWPMSTRRPTFPDTPDGDAPRGDQRKTAPSACFLLPEISPPEAMAGPGSMPGPAIPRATGIARRNLHLSP